MVDQARRHPVLVDVVLVLPYEREDAFGYDRSQRRSIPVLGVGGQIAGCLRRYSPCTGPARSITQFEHEWGSIERAFRNASTQRGAWRAWERGFAPAPGEGRDGSTAIRARAAGRTNAGASQSVQLGQGACAPGCRVWTKADDVSGEPDNNYALYIDLTYADGTPRLGVLWPPRPPAPGTGSYWSRPSVPRSL